MPKGTVLGIMSMLAGDALVGSAQTIGKTEFDYAKNNAQVDFSKINSLKTSFSSTAIVYTSHSKADVYQNKQYKKPHQAVREGPTEGPVLLALSAWLLYSIATVDDGSKKTEEVNLNKKNNAQFFKSENKLSKHRHVKKSHDKRASLASRHR